MEWLKLYLQKQMLEWEQKKYIYDFKKIMTISMDSTYELKWLKRSKD